MLVTRPFVIAGPRLWFNVDAARADVTIEVLDSTGAVVARSHPVTRDVRRGAVPGAGGNLQDRRGKTCRMRWSARRASLDAYCFAEQ